MHAYFNSFDIQMTADEARSASQPGRDAQEDVRALLRTPKIARQLRKIDPDKIRAELREYGAWDADELANDAANRERIVWIAAGNITEELAEKRRGKRMLGAAARATPLYVCGAQRRLMTQQQARQFVKQGRGTCRVAR